MIHIPSKSIRFATDPNTFIIDQEGQYSIDSIRELINWAYKKPFNKSYKIVFIDRCEQLSPEGQNALLKVLEEPPAHTFIVLSCIQPERIIATIRSRCTLINHVNMLQDQQLGEWIQDIQLTDTQTADYSHYPRIDSFSDALTQADRLNKKYSRSELIQLLNDWTTELIQDPSPHNLRIIDEISSSLEKLQANTNCQLTLEVLFLSTLTTP